VRKDSVPPVAEVTLEPYSAEEAEEETELEEEPRRWVSVAAAPGEDFVLQHFERRDVYRFRTSGPHWVG
jgi:hypothetical protein